MSFSPTKSASNSSVSNNPGCSQNLSDDSELNLSESMPQNDLSDKISRKRKAESETSENDSPVSSNHESTVSNAQKHSRRMPHDPDCPPFDWQSTKQSLKDRTAYIFEKELFCDVCFNVGHGSLTQRISANKVILSIGSAVFDAMFSGEWAAKSNDIEVPDVEPAAFSSVLRYLYTDDVSITADTVMAILYAAKKYAVPSLEDKCRSYLLSILSPQNAFTILNQARSFDERRLARSCLRNIASNSVEAFSSDSITDIDSGTLCLVLKRNTLKIREIEIFKAVCRWSEAELARQNIPKSQENYRSVLEMILPLIRFPLMTAKEVSLSVVPSGLLPDSQLVSLFTYLSVNPKPPINFTCVPRSPEAKIWINRFEFTEEMLEWEYVEDVANSIGFCCDQEIWFSGYGVYNQSNDEEEIYELSVTLVDTITSNVLYEWDSAEEVLQGSGGVSSWNITQPVKLAARTNYTLTLNMKGPPTCYGIEGKEEVTVDMPYGGQVTISFNTVGDIIDDQVHSNVARGQIPSLQFCFK